ncbi:MAG: hypothetical protein IKM64_09835 [Clostridia bacterium]|nr:hypothetical protein [Clostridia bacterium]
MKKDFLKSPLAVKLILGLAAFTVCLIPLQLLQSFVPLNRWVALILKLLCGHAGVILLFKWLRTHPEDQRPGWFPGLVTGALAGAVLYLVLTALKLLGSGSLLLEWIRVLCPAGLGLIGAWTYKKSLTLKEANKNG